MAARKPTGQDGGRRLEPAEAADVGDHDELPDDLAPDDVDDDNGEENGDDEDVEEDAEFDDEAGSVSLARIAAFDEEDDEVARVVADDDDEVDDDIDGLRAGEFVCRSCFMAKRESALADPKRLLCRDCV